MARACQVLSYEEGRHRRGATRYAKDWLENRLLTMIKRTLTNITGTVWRFDSMVWNKELDAGR